MESIAHFVTEILHYRLFEINRTPVTLSSIFMFFLVILIFYLISRFLQRVLKNNIIPILHFEKSVQYTLARVSHYLIMIIGCIVGFQFIGVNLSGLAVIVGFLSVGIGFGLQNITSNFIAGIILLFERPIKIGDRVTVEQTEGFVTSINMRATTIRSLNNISIIVPNSKFISSEVINWSYGDPRVRLVVEVGVSYTSNLDLVLKSLAEVAEENPRVLKNPEADVLFAGFGESAWNMKLRVWLADPHDYYQILSELNCDIVRKFATKGIEIPFPQRDLHLRSLVPIPVFGEKQERPG